MTDFNDKLKNLNKTVTSNKSKLVLVEKEFKKIRNSMTQVFLSVKANFSMVEYNIT